MARKKKNQNPKKPTPVFANIVPPNRNPSSPSTSMNYTHLLEKKTFPFEITNMKEILLFLNKKEKSREVPNNAICYGKLKYFGFIPDFH